MGYNTTVVVLNDALGFIESDPEFGRKLAAAIMEASAYRKRVAVPARSTGGGAHCNAATVIESHHADYDVFVKVGGNYGEVADGVLSLIAAAEDFIDKVDRGEARSTKSYKQFSEALAKLKQKQTT